MSTCKGNTAKLCLTLVNSQIICFFFQAYTIICCYRFVYNKELSCHLLNTGFQQSKADPCVYFQWKDGHLNIVSIYVDDLILVVDLLKDLLRTKEELFSRFKMKDLGQLRYCLGIVCVQEDGCIRINQRPYIDNLVKRFGLTDTWFA